MISIKAYPTREFGDMVWAYLGPRERMPEGLPQLEVGVLPPSPRYVTKRLQQCNWAHSMEGALDTAHFSFLHMPAPKLASNENPEAAADENRLRWLRNDPMPQFTGHASYRVRSGGALMSSDIPFAEVMRQRFSRAPRGRRSCTRCAACRARCAASAALPRREWSSTRSRV